MQQDVREEEVNANWTISGMEKLGLKYSLEDGQAMGKGQGRVDPMK